MAEIFGIKSFIRKIIFHPKSRLMPAGGHNRFLKAAACFLLPALLLLASLPALASGVSDGMVIRDGMAQPIAAYTDAASLDYTNEGSDILRFVVYVETDHDTDLDGKADLVKTLVQVPRAASEGRYAAPALYEARPYIAGMYGYNPTLMPVGEASFDEACLYTKPEKRVPSQETTTLLHAENADPSDWYYHLDSDPFDQQYMGNLTAYDYYLVRGFAIIQAAGLGTWGSEGILCCGSDLEAEAFACVVE